MTEFWRTQEWQSQVPQIIGHHKLSITNKMSEKPQCQKLWRESCQTRIGIGVRHILRKLIGLILESEVTVIVDQFQCVKTDCKYLRSSS